MVEEGTHVISADQSKITLFNDIQDKATILIEFLNRQCESIELNSGQRNLDWRLSINTDSERPKYIVLGFQRNKFTVTKLTRLYSTI